jgi:hypothetical protein
MVTYVPFFISVFLCAHVGAFAAGAMTPTPSQLAAMTPEQIQQYRLQTDLDERNRPLTDEDLDEMFKEHPGAWPCSCACYCCYQ